MQENPVATKPQQTLLTNMGDLQNTAGTSWHERKGDNIYRTKRHWLSNRGTLPCKHIIKWSWGKENWHSRCQNPKQYKRIKKTATHGLYNSTRQRWHKVLQGSDAALHSKCKKNMGKMVQDLQQGLTWNALVAKCRDDKLKGNELQRPLGNKG